MTTWRTGFVRSLVAIAAAGGLWLGMLAPAREARAERQRNAAAMLDESARRTADIAFYARRAAEDPQGAEDRAMLAGLHLQRAREGGGRADYSRAERIARASLDLRRGRNGKSMLILASALLAQHEFPEALKAASGLVATAPDVPGYRALLAELLLEMGRYDEAAAQFDSLRTERSSLPVAPRYARYLELRGDDEAARAVLRRALEAAKDDRNLPREQLAWFHLRVADQALRNGRLEEAGKAIANGLHVAPSDVRLVLLRARLHAEHGEWRAVVRDVESVGAAADIASLALAGDAWEKSGDHAAATRWWNAAERSALENPEPFNRQWTLFRLEHGIAVEETRALLEREIAVRTDVYGWGQLALARLLTSEVGGAREAMAQAKRLGTRDSWLDALSARIARAAGDSVP